MIRKYSFFLIFFYSFFVFSQKNVDFSFKQPWPNNESFDLAYKKGIQEAKVEALRKAGVKENIKSFSRLYTSEDNTGFNEIFQSDILTDLSGRIIEWDVSDPMKTCNDNISYITFEVDAKVKKYKQERDQKFVATISPEPKDFYMDEANIEFRLMPFEDCFVKIFYISETSEQLMYPLKNTDPEKEKKYLLNKKWVKEKFHPIDWMTVAKDREENEKGQIVIVLTKKDIPFDNVTEDDDGWLSVTNSEDIFKWILNIERHERMEYHYSFFIK
tara:strand:+ start:33 stop:848 length:816 start_codon:yes stop_codon:yes gene_type:complete